MDAAAVVQQMPDIDLICIFDSGKIPVNGLVQFQFSIFHCFQDQYGGEGFGNGTDPVFCGGIRLLFFAISAKPSDLE